jgi:chemotaxis protein CheZ
VSSATAPDAISPEVAFERLGHITRQLHEAMSELGLDRGLKDITQQFPDACDRLSHVGHMTETAANKVLNLVDEAQPQCQYIKQQSQSMLDTLGQLRHCAGPGNGDVVDVVATCQMFSSEAAQFADRQKAILVDIMMTQDFQDLSGQIIKKVIDIIGQTEKQLLTLLVESAPVQPEIISATPRLAGPQVPDKALKQNDVDDLLASLGF